MKKKTVVSVTVVAMLFAVALFYVGGTYARYTDEFTGTATVNIAKWAVKVTDAEEKKFTPTFTYAASDYIADNKLAPTRSMEAEIEIDLTGTEVAVDVLAEVDTSQLTSQIGASKIDVTAMIDGSDATEETGALVALTGKTAFTEENGKKKLKITITWDNQEDQQNAADTKVGTDITSLTIPVTVTLQQHIAE